MSHLHSSAITVVSPSAKNLACLRHEEEAVSHDSLAQFFYDDMATRTIYQWKLWCPYIGRIVAMRGRYIEDMVSLIIEKRGIKQMMNIAAGLNTFPYRNDHAVQLTRYAELDLPQMIVQKKKIIAELKHKGISIEAKCPVEHHHVDLLSQHLDKEFQRANWNWQEPCIYVLEGMSYYMTREQLRHFLDLMQKNMAVGSVLIMDYFPIYVKTSEALLKILASIHRDQGETCHTYLTLSDVEDLFKNFTVVRDVLENHLEKDYYDDLICKPIGSIIVAEKKS